MVIVLIFCFRCDFVIESTSGSIETAVTNNALRLSADGSISQATLNTSMSRENVRVGSHVCYTGDFRYPGCMLSSGYESERRPSQEGAFD